MAAHSYWRVYVTANNGAGLLSLVEIEMRLTPGGADQCSGGTVLFSTQYDASSNAAANAFDNNVTTTKWTATAATGYIGYQFPAAVDVKEILITGPISGQSTSAPKDFTLDYSDDGSSWTTLGTWTNQTTWTALEQRAFTVYTVSGSITESLSITDWRVTVIDAKTLTTLASAVFSGSTYAIDFTATGPLLHISIAPKIDYKWSTAKVAALNDYVVPSAPDTTSHLWKVTTAGTFAATEATWNLSGTTTQGTAVLTYVAPLVNPVALGFKTL